MSTKLREVHVTIGDGTAVFRRNGQTNPVVAGILGVEKDEKGEIKKVFLDRLVHRHYETAFIGWNVSGAVSSVLVRTKQ